MFHYRGADKFLARPGRKQAQKHVRDARDFNNIETRALIKFFFFLQGKAPKEINAILTEILACFFTGRDKDLSAPLINHLTPNDHCSGRTAPLPSNSFILYIYSTNIGTEYFKHGVYSTFFPFQNAVCFIILTYLVPVLFIFYIQGVLK